MHAQVMQVTVQEKPAAFSLPKVQPQPPAALENTASVAATVFTAPSPCVSADCGAPSGLTSHSTKYASEAEASSCSEVSLCQLPEPPAAHGQAVHSSPDCCVTAALASWPLHNDTTTYTRLMLVHLCAVQNTKCRRVLRSADTCAESSGGKASTSDGCSQGSTPAPAAAAVSNKPSKLSRASSSR